MFRLYSYLLHRLQPCYKYIFSIITSFVLHLQFVKISAFILSVIVLILSCMPCTDGAKAMGNPYVKVEAAKTSDPHNNSQRDHCTPFCQCACCAAFSIVQPITKLILIKPKVQKSYSSFYSSSVKGISLPVWQPPQLA